jgi:hypothetical protein
VFLYPDEAKINASSKEWARAVGRVQINPEEETGQGRPNEAVTDNGDGESHPGSSASERQPVRSEEGVGPVSN